MLEGGAKALADSRDENLLRLRAALPYAELHRIHLPSLTSPSTVADVSYVSTWEGAAAVAGAAATAAAPSPRATRRRRLVILLETGDEREGVPIADLLSLAEKIDSEPRLILEGIATNFACFRGQPEDIEASVQGVAAAAAALRQAGLDIARVSGGNSSLLWLLARGRRLPPQITELRCGEGLLLGQDALYYEPLPGCGQDACVLWAEILEEYTKPAEPTRPQGADAAVRVSAALPGGRRLVLGVGHQDLGRGRVTFVEPALREIGRSADYLVVEVGSAESGVDRDQGQGGFRVGSRVAMIPSYEALVAAWSSPYVEVTLVGK